MNFKVPRQSPKERYLAHLNEPGFIDDPVQRKVIAELDALYERLSVEYLTGRTGIDRLKDKLFGKSVRPVIGLYLWGGVGRGKTFLMDLFFDSLPFPNKLRMHFHHFMYRVHRDLKQYSGRADPLKIIAADIANEGRVLCFDEFFVSDIGDAMILAGLMGALFEKGVTLVATSNIPPEQLYRDGLQRSRFLPAIELLQKYTRVVDVDGQVDYRLRLLAKAEIYHCPLDDEADNSLRASLMSLAPDKIEAGVELDVEGRTMHALFQADDVVWFDFPAICQGPRSQNDYIALARVFHAVLISNVPVFNPDTEDQARRFISLVDEFYDRGVKLIVSAEAAIEGLYAGNKLVFEFERTQSRLLEMQSEEYLARGHRS